MPLFMMLSGYFSSKILRKQIDIKKRLITLILPCVSFYAICYSIGIYNQNFWYLKSLFICYLVYSILCFLPISWKVKHIIIVIGLIIFAPLMPLIRYLDVCKIDFMLPFFGMGLIIAQSKDYILSHSKCMALVSLACFIGLLVVWDWHHIWYFSRPSWIDYRELVHNHRLIFDLSNLYSYILRFLIGAVGSLCMFSLFSWMNKASVMANNIFETLGRYGMYSLHIYLIQSIVFSIIEMLMDITITHIGLYSYCIAPLVALTITASCIFVASLLKKVTLLDFVLFGNYNYLQKNGSASL